MNRIRLGMILVLCGWLIGVLSPVVNWISFVKEKIELNSGYEKVQAEIVLDKTDYDEMTGYKKVTLKYDTQAGKVEKVMSKEEYMENEYHPFVNGGLVNIIYEINSPQTMRVATTSRLVSSTLKIIILTMIAIYIFKNIYPEAVRRHKKEYRNEKFVDAKILSSDNLNRIIAMDDNANKIRIFRSFPFFNEINNMSLFLKSKNIEKIRVYFDEKNESKIVMDYEVLSEVENND